MKVWKYAVTGYLGGMIYVGLELLWRRWSHGSMFLVGGICFLLIGLIPRLLPGVPELMQAVLGACAVTATELISGLIINDALKLHVWDYSAMPYNFLGQVCMSYFFLWIIVSWMALELHRLLRWKLFGDKPEPCRRLWPVYDRKKA